MSAKLFYSLFYLLAKPAVWGGLAGVGFLLFFYGNSLWQLLSRQAGESWQALLAESYFHHVLLFSFGQAFLSALLSISGGLLIAHALFYQHFAGKSWLLKLFSLSMVLPVLVAIFGLLGVYGRAGWLHELLLFLHIDWRPNGYGLSGILLAHVFFNLPLSSKIFYQTLQSIPHQQRRLACQLGIIDWHFIRLVEWPYVRQQVLPVFSLIFMLCFTSFTVVLTMGGGPKYTTLEVAIYQAITFDFELSKAAMLALVQFALCFILFQLSAYFAKTTPTAVNAHADYIVPMPRYIAYGHRFILVVTVIFLLLPLLQVVISGLDIRAWQLAWDNPQLWRALGYSLIIAPTAGLVCLLFTLLLLLGARQFHYRQAVKTASSMVNVGMTILAIPSLVLAVGLYLLLQQFTINNTLLFIIVVLCNALLAMPFAIRLLMLPLYNNMVYYERLCAALGIVGWQRWKLIEWQSIKRPCQRAFALASALSLGDFTAIALFGNQDFTSLPRLLYQQIGHYRNQEAGVTALLLLLFCSLIFLLLDSDDKIKKPVLPLPPRA